MTKGYEHTGFTLLEFVIVIVMIGIMSVFALFQWQGSTITLEAQAQQLAEDLRYTQSLSMTKGQRYRWVKTSANSYQILNSAGTPITFARGNTTITFTGNIVFGTLTNLPSNLVAFDGKGAPYTDTGSPGTALASTATIPLTADSETKTVSISPETGRVIVS